MAMPWSFAQLLDPVALESAPLGSLLLLHGQPPMLNGLATLCLALGRWSPLEAASWAALLFYGLTLASAFMIHDLGRRIGGSLLHGRLAVTCLLAHPACLLYGKLFFTPMLLLCLLLATVFFAARWQDGRDEHPLFLVLTLASLSLTHPLYHPIGMMLVLPPILLRPGRKELRGKMGRAGILLVVLLSFWPLKNLLVFGSFSMHGWTGHALSRFLSVEERVDLDRYLQRGKVDEELLRRARALEARFGMPDAARVLSRSRKLRGGAINWNHLLLLEESGKLTWAGLRWRFHHPGLWGRRIVANALQWARPSWLHPYDGQSLLPAGPLRCWGRVWEGTLFFDLAPLLRRMLPLDALWALWKPSERPLPLFLPLLLGLLLIPARRGRGKLPWLCRVAILWTLVIPCLSDGAEGNRMGFAISPLLVLLLLSLQGSHEGERPDAARSSD